MPHKKTCIVNYELVSQIVKIDSETTKATLHEEIEIKCFYEGSAILLIGSEEVPVKAGDVVVINPYEFHATVAVGKNSGKYHIIMVPLDFFFGIEELNLRKLFFSEKKMFKTLFSADREIYGILIKVADESRKKEEFYELRIRSLLMELFSLLLRRGLADSEYSVAEKTTISLYGLIDPALSCIKRMYSEELTLDYLAGLCGVSKHYFCRAFKSITKKTPMEYLRDYRLQMANILLSDNENGISEISALCGFCDTNYFSRCYKKKYGVSPRESRKEKITGKAE
ncbi:MAG: AraC family transcriptional regulator [Oscillospiraceae bacterium]|nr:AraC family transcriptional regulator [Oscillospiraceae bacterium]